MSWDENGMRTHVNMLQTLQREIDFLQKIYEARCAPSLEKIIEMIRNSQDKLYNSLAIHGVTPEDAYRIIMKNNDKEPCFRSLKAKNPRPLPKNASTTPIYHLKNANPSNTP